MGDIGEKVEGVSKEDTLHVGDGFYPGDVGVDFCFLFNVTGIIDSKAIEEIHEDNNNEKDEGQEKDVGHNSKIGVTVYGYVTELQLSNKHGRCLHQGDPSSVEERI